MAWIIDLGATDHVTQGFTLFETCKPDYHNKKINVVDGNSVPIASQGDVKSVVALTLKKFLHVSKLSTNLISVHQLTKDLNNRVIFSHHDSVFHEMSMGRRIRAAKEQNGMYHLKMDHGVAKEISLLLLVHHKTNLLVHHDVDIDVPFSFGTPTFPFTSNFVSFIV